MRPISLISLCALSLLPVLVSAETAPYAGLESRPVKALSAKQIEGYRLGKGMSLALAAELNGYPGPRHVLGLSGELGLTEAQKIEIESLFANMQQEAQALGEQVIREETRLDHLFASGHINEDALNDMTRAIAVSNGRLRFVHLKYHLDTKALLNQQQIETYNSLRGYAGQGEHSPAGHHLNH